MGKILSMFATLCIVCTAIYGQTPEELFVKADSTNWTEIVSTATKKNQMILVDFYATWCGPCKQMDKEVFSKEEVRNFLHEHFTTVKVDIDSPFGKRMKALYKVNAYPTYVFIDHNQQELDRKIGKSGSTKFLRWAKASSGKQ